MFAFFLTSCCTNSCVAGDWRCLNTHASSQWFKSWMCVVFIRALPDREPRNQLCTCIVFSEEGCVPSQNQKQIILVCKYIYWRLIYTHDNTYIYCNAGSLHMSPKWSLFLWTGCLIYESDLCWPGSQALTNRWINFPAWISNNIHYFVWDEITYPYPNFNGCTSDVWEVISSHILLGVWLLIHAGIKVNLFWMKIVPD